MVANEIYTTTRDGLAALVSRQVADSVLRRALAAHGSDGDRVDAELMSRVLRGDVRRALERSLPRAGVRRHLATLDARLAARAAVTDPDPETVDAPVAEPAPAADTSPTADTPPGDVPTREVAPEAVARSEAAFEPAAPDAASRPARRRGPDAPPASLLDRLGDQDALRQWIWAPTGGTPIGRGAGPRPQRAQRLLAPLMTVLDRAGAVRSLHVDHGTGHVLIGRAPGATLAVTGDPDMNLGAIYAAFRALEEEP